MEFNCHTDDVFMATGMYDPVLNDEGKITYRITPADLDVCTKRKKKKRDKSTN